MFIGADVDVLRSIANGMREQADALAGVQGTLGKIIESVPWSGPDFQRFRSNWGRSSKSLTAAVGDLRRAAATLDRNAKAQEQVSSDLSFSSRSGQLGHAQDLLGLSRAALDHTTGENHRKMIPEGWREVGSDELRSMGLNPSDFGSPGDDFSATLYRNSDGNYVVAFEGTNPGDLRDIVTDAVGAAWISRQGERAVNLGAAVKQQIARSGSSAQLEFTGWSLGGELATLAAVGTGENATTFNSAGSSGVALLVASANRWSHGGPILGSSRIDNYANVNDPLTDAEFMIPGIPRAPGDYHFYTPHSDGFFDHGLEGLEAAIEEDRLTGIDD